MMISDFANRLISERDILNNLVIIFPDSIILQKGFKIKSIDKTIVDYLGFQESELLEQSINILSSDNLLPKRLERELSNGFFKGLRVTFKGKKNKLIPCQLSGFYLGLISEINGYVVIKVNPLDDKGLFSKQLEASRNELDEFVYRATHDLRGPLATMLGIINLMKRESSLSELKYLVDLLDIQAKIQDDRLYNLSYLSVSAQTKILEHNLDINELESTLRSTIEENIPIDSIDFHFNSTRVKFENINSKLATALLNHLLLYVINLPKVEIPRLSYSLSSHDGGMKVLLESFDFCSSYQLRQAISKGDPLYTTVILYPQLINFFAAQKTAQRLGATIETQVEEHHQLISIWVPKLRLTGP